MQRGKHTTEAGIKQMHRLFQRVCIAIVPRNKL